MNLPAIFYVFWKENQQSVENQVIVEKNKQDAERKTILLSITKTIILCGRQEIALRGTCDSGNIFRENDLNDGNFRSLLRFRIDSRDGILNKHLEYGPRNAQYTSPTIQNELIDLCGKHIQKQLVEKINKARGFSILCDETTDISGIENRYLYVHAMLIKKNRDYVKIS